MIEPCASYSRPVRLCSSAGIFNMAAPELSEEGHTAGQQILTSGAGDLGEDSFQTPTDSLLEGSWSLPSLRLSRSNSDLRGFSASTRLQAIPAEPCQRSQTSPLVQATTGCFRDPTRRRYCRVSGASQGSPAEQYMSQDSSPGLDRAIEQAAPRSHLEQPGASSRASHVLPEHLLAADAAEQQHLTASVSNRGHACSSGKRWIPNCSSQPAYVSTGRNCVWEGRLESSNTADLQIPDGAGLATPRIPRLETSAGASLTVILGMCPAKPSNGLCQISIDRPGPDCSSSFPVVGPLNICA